VIAFGCGAVEFTNAGKHLVTQAGSFAPNAIHGIECVAAQMQCEPACKAGLSHQAYRRSLVAVCAARACRC
jgi:hypothetical protein